MVKRFIFNEWNDEYIGHYTWEHDKEIYNLDDEFPTQKTRYTLYSPHFNKPLEFDNLSDLRKRAAERMGPRPTWYEKTGFIRIGNWVI